MTNWQFNSEENTGILSFEGDVTIGHVADLKARLVEAFENANEVVVDVSMATAIDVAGVQLLCACHRFSNNQGKKMCIRLGENDRFLDFLEEVGFSRVFVCNNGNNSDCLWNVRH